MHAELLHKKISNMRITLSVEKLDFDRALRTHGGLAMRMRRYGTTPTYALSARERYLQAASSSGQRLAACGSLVVL